MDEKIYKIRIAKRRLQPFTKNNIIEKIEAYGIKVGVKIKIVSYRIEEDCIFAEYTIGENNED